MRASQKRLHVDHVGPGAVVDTDAAHSAPKRRKLKTINMEPTLAARVTAGEDFRTDLLYRWATGKVSSEDLVTISYHHTRSGGLGVSDIGVGPILPTSNANRKVRNALGISCFMSHYYVIKVPRDVPAASM